MNDILLFDTTRSVIKAEELCRAHGLAVQVIPVPKYLSSECGMALSVPAGDGVTAVDLLGKHRLTVKLHETQRSRPQFDLLTTVEYGGCSAKLPATLLADALRTLPRPTDARLLVGVDTCDDAGVYRLTDDLAIIETVDFFPPICSDPYEFGQIAAANALSDVFAMGGRVVTCMNLMMFPAEGIPIEVMVEILRGGQDKVTEAGGLIVGGHTIADYPPKYGLAVTGTVHPDKVISNAGAKPGDVLVLTKPIGTGVLVSGHRIGETQADDYQQATKTMKQLNQRGAEIMQEFGIHAATDITGFGLLGHAIHIANASKVTLQIEASRVPALAGAMKLLTLGCIPGGAFRNLAYVEKHTRFDATMSYELKMLLLDPQTSGGLLMCIAPERVEPALSALHKAGYSQAVMIGTVKPQNNIALDIVVQLSI